MADSLKVRVAAGTQVADADGVVHGPGEVVTLPVAMAQTLTDQGLVTEVQPFRAKRTVAKRPTAKPDDKG